MRHEPTAAGRLPALAALSGLILLAACGGRSGDAEVQRALQDISAIEDAGLSDVMLTVGDPGEAVAFFTRKAAEDPSAIAPLRGLAKSLVRAGRATEAVAAWQRVIAHPQSGWDDHVDLAGAQIRTDDWAGARATLNAVPPTHETYERYRLEAMVADAAEDWGRADSFYEIAAGLTTTPAGVLNNWGFSKLTRGDYAAAERLFADALRHNPRMFTAKNNLVMARGAQRKYDLPVVPMTQEERAQLLYTLALTAIKQNDVTIGRGLLREAVDTHPRHFEEAARALEALETGG
jgi:Flp pilus assembly protein TadD